MADAVADLRRSLAQRLEAVEQQITDTTALIEERDRLRAALDALGEPTNSAGPTAPRRETRTARRTGKTSSQRRARRSSRRRSGSARAKPGENTAKVLAVIDERPGVSAVEISQVAKLPQPTTYTTISRLAKGGRIEEVELGTGRGWRTKQPAETSAS